MTLPVGIDPIYESHIWLQQTLLDSPDVVTAFGGRISAHPAPRDTAYPLCTHAFATPHQNSMIVGGNVYCWELRFIVSGYIDGRDTVNMPALSGGAKAIYEALHLSTGLTDDAEIIGCWQERPYSQTEIITTIQYLRQGGEYIIQIRPRD